MQLCSEACVAIILLTSRVRGYARFNEKYVTGRKKKRTIKTKAQIF